MSEYLYVTPGTRLGWSTLADWCDVAARLDSRAASLARTLAIEAHVRALSAVPIAACRSEDTIGRALWWLVHGPSGFSRPPRGARGSAPHTPLIMALKNQAMAIARDCAEPPNRPRRRQRTAAAWSTANPA